MNIIHSTKQEDKVGDSSSPSGGVRVVSRSENELMLEVYGDASHCLDEICENRPAEYLDWHLENLAEAIKLANDGPRCPLPPWMIGAYPITVRHL